ncbi:MAG: N-acetyltransferase family protein [Actinomycetota bacterium]|nr:N-acetyltransferase family protein [Actinomycetota bacterium]
MLIRHADPALDAAACAAIYAPYVSDTVISLEEQPPDEHEFKQRMQHITRTHPWLVAVSDGAVTGYAYASAHRERAAYRWAVDVTVYMGQEHRRRGAGRALYGELFGLLRLQGFHVACAGVTLPNEASVGFHEALGFVPVGIYKRVAWKMGAWWDVGWWQLELAEPTEGKPAEPVPPALGRATT